MKSKLTKAGGARPGSGAKKKEPTKGINHRVPVKWHAHFVALVKAELKRLRSEE